MNGISGLGDMRLGAIATGRKKAGVDFGSILMNMVEQKMGSGNSAAENTAASVKTGPSAIPAKPEVLEEIEGIETEQSAVSGQKELERRAEKIFESAPASFEEMKNGLAEKQKAFDQLMQDAKEISGYHHPVTQTTVGAIYIVGPYAVHIPETGTWQWYNEDGAPRDGRPPQDEFDAQMRASEEKVKKHSGYLRENDHFAKFAEIARDAALLGFAETEDQFKDDYLSDPGAVVRQYAGELLGRHHAYSYNSGSRTFIQTYKG